MRGSESEDDKEKGRADLRPPPTPTKAEKRVVKTGDRVKIRIGSGTQVVTKNTHIRTCAQVIQGIRNRIAQGVGKNKGKRQRKGRRKACNSNEMKEIEGGAGRPGLQEKKDWAHSRRGGETSTDITICDARRVCGNNAAMPYAIAMRDGAGEDRRSNRPMSGAFFLRAWMRRGEGSAYEWMMNSDCQVMWCGCVRTRVVLVLVLASSLIVCASSFVVRAVTRG